MPSRLRFAPALFLLLSISAPIVASGQTRASSASPAAFFSSKTSVLTYHNDVNRTGWNSHETVLTTANVNASSFGLLHTVAVDGRVDAQPLVVPNERLPGLELQAACGLSRARPARCATRQNKAGEGGHTSPCSPSKCPVAATTMSP
jgi:hypothetical protein